MQAFYNQLTLKSKPCDSYLRVMGQLTQASLGQMLALEGAPSWQPWDATTS
jgi:hypothetical protein